MRRQVEWADFVSVAEAQGYAERGVMWVDLAVASDSTSLSPDRVKGRTIILSLDPLQPAGEFWLLFSEPAFCLLADAGFFMDVIHDKSNRLGEHPRGICSGVQPV